MAEEHEQRGSAERIAVGAALILIGLGAGVAGASAASTSWLVRAAGAAAGAVVGLAIGIWFDRRKARTAALRARDGVLHPLRDEPADNGSVFDVLLATSTEAAPFVGRKADLDRLDRWWSNTDLPIMVVTGPGGTGKTRLVTQFALGRPVPWVGGWLKGDCGVNALAAIRACGDPVLVLVDEGDQRPDLAPFLASLKADPQAKTAVRVILISRAADLVNRLAASLEDRSRGILNGVPELPLGPFGGADDRARWFREAVRAYAKVRRVPPPDLPAQLAGNVTDPAEPILSLHAQALLAVLDSAASRPQQPDTQVSSADAEVQPFDQVVKALFVHEQNRWEALAKLPEFGLADLTPAVQAHAIAALFLTRASDQDQAAAVLRRVPGLASKVLAERRANISRWAAHLYPSDPPWPIRIKPDMLGEWFVVTHLTQTPELVDLLRVMTHTQEVSLLVLLAQASDRLSEAVRLFAHVVAADTPRLAEAAVAAALTAGRGLPRLDAALADLISEVTWSADTLGRIESRLTDRLPRTQAAAWRARVEIARKDHNAVELAKALDTLGNHLSGLGRDQQALAANEEAVDLWRALTRDDPAHQPGLAAALNNLGNRLYRLGRDQQALSANEEAVALWRALAQDDPARQPGLATALANLGNQLSRLGQDQDAFVAAEEAVDLLRRLAQDNPAHQPGLAMALSNLGIRLNRLGQGQQALAAYEEAVDLWRALARDDPARQPGLAKALTNLGNLLDRLDRRREALAYTEEAADLYQPLARDNSAYQPDLAMALHALGTCLHHLSRDKEALAVLGKAVGMYRRLARDNPAHEPDLAATLGELANCLRGLGRELEALAAAEEAVDMSRGLARDNPAHQPDLAGALIGLGVQLSSLGRREDALAATEEAIDLFRRLAQDNPAHQGNLAIALGNLKIQLEKMGRDREAIAAKPHLDDDSMNRQEQHSNLSTSNPSERVN